MANELVHVPVPLLLSPDLPASAKLIWMVSKLGLASGQSGSTWLSANSGLSRPTVLKAMAQLAAAAWVATGPYESTTVPTPAALVTDRRLGIHARVTYGLLLLTPGFHHPHGRFAHAELAALAHASPNTVAKAVGELARAEWIKVERANRLDRIHFELTFPGFSREQTALAMAQRRLSKSKHFGEGLMREFLSLLVDSDEYSDDARPGFMVNPRSGELLELDRFYPPRVAFEFNGPQHYRATDMYTAEESAAQRERDYIKMGICLARGVTLVVVHPGDLTLSRMREMVGDLLPQRNLAGFSMLIEYLESESHTYRRTLRRLGH